MDLSIHEVQTRLLYKQEIPCRDYSDANDSFIGCCKQQIWSNLKKNISCKLVGFENLMEDPKELRWCRNRREGIDTFVEFIGLVKNFVGQTDSYGCLLPCLQTTYGLNLNYFHKNSWIDTEETPVSDLKTIELSCTPVVVF